MSNSHKSSAHVQMQTEKVLFDKVEDLLKVNLEKNKKSKMLRKVGIWRKKNRKNQTWKTP